MIKSMFKRSLVVPMRSWIYLFILSLSDANALKSVKYRNGRYNRFACGLNFYIFFSKSMPNSIESIPTSRIVVPLAWDCTEDSRKTALTPH